jgi:hypothetical protein
MLGLKQVNLDIEKLLLNIVKAQQNWHVVGMYNKACRCF